MTPNDDPLLREVDELLAVRACELSLLRDTRPCVGKSRLNLQLDIARLERERKLLRALRDRLVEAEASAWCDACCGTGTPASGERCICGGGGLASMAVTHLRVRLVEAEMRIAALESENARLRDALVNMLTLISPDYTGDKIAGYLRALDLLRDNALTPRPTEDR